MATLYKLELKDSRGRWRSTPFAFRSRKRAEDTIIELDPKRKKEFRIVPMKVGPPVRRTPTLEELDTLTDEELDGIAGTSMHGTMGEDE